MIKLFNFLIYLDLDSITFLGTGGGRFVLLTQKRHSGGFILELGGQNILFDPGPGAFIRLMDLGFNPRKIDVIISTHNHLDHYGDVEVMAEAMTNGLRRNHGLLVLQKDVESYISKYHLEKLDAKIISAGDTFKFNDLNFTALPTFNHSNAVGVKIQSDDKTITYSSDTAFDKELLVHYKNSDILILNSLFPYGLSSKSHLNMDDVRKICDDVKPKKTFLTHFGVQMIVQNPKTQAEKMRSELDVDVVAAEDGKKYTLL